MVVGGVDHRVEMALLQLDRLLRLPVRVASRIRERGRVTLRNQEMIRDPVSLARGAMKCYGLNKVQITTQSFLVITTKNSQRPLLPIVLSQGLSETFRPTCDSPFMRYLCSVYAIHLVPFDLRILSTTCGHPLFDALMFTPSSLKVTAQLLILYHSALDPRRLLRAGHQGYTMPPITMLLPEVHCSPTIKSTILAT